MNTNPLADAVLEIAASEIQHLFDDLTLTFNSLADLLRDQGILRGRELAELSRKASAAVKAAQSPLEKLTYPQCLPPTANSPRRPRLEGQAASQAHRSWSDPPGHHEDPAPCYGHCGARPGSGRRQGEGLPRLSTSTAISGRTGGQAAFQEGCNQGLEESREALPGSHLQPRAGGWAGDYEAHGQDGRSERGSDGGRIATR